MIDPRNYNGPPEEITTIDADAAADDFTTLTGVAVSPYRWPVLACDECGCLFAPDTDGETFYPDRRTLFGEDGDAGCHTGQTECACHAIAYSIPLDPPEDQ